MRLLMAVGLAFVLAACSAASGETVPPTAPAPSAAPSSVAAPATTPTTAAPSSAPAPPRQFTGADGVVSEVEDVSRIVTLAGELTEIVWELGHGDSVVGRDVTTVYPPEAIAVPIVGVGRFLNAEAVLKLGPTLVLADTQTSPVEAIEQLRAAGVAVVVLEVVTEFDMLYEKIRDIGEVLDEPAAADALAERVEAGIGAAMDIAAGAAESPMVAFVYTRGPDVMLLFGKGMVTNPMIESAGGIDGGVAIGVNGYVPVTPEALITIAPDVLIVPTEGLEAHRGVDGLLEFPGVGEALAAKGGRVLAYPEGDFLTLGPRIAETLLALVYDLHPDLGGP